MRLTQNQKNMAKREKKTIISGVTRDAADDALAMYALAEAQAAKIEAAVPADVALWW